MKNYTHFSGEKAKINKKNTENLDKINSINYKKDGFILNKLLVAYNEENISSENIIEFLNKLNPYVIDLEIRSLDPIVNINDNNNYLLLFSKFLLQQFKKSNENFEMLQSYLNRFIKIFNEEIIENDEIKRILKEINDKNIERFEEIERLYNQTMCLVSYFGDLQI